MTRHNVIKFFFLAALQVTSATALGGHAQGNGGLMRRDLSNPWFLENTTSVRYCIDIDTQHFGVSIDQASREIRAVIDDWKDAFARAEDGYYNPGQLAPFG